MDDLILILNSLKPCNAWSIFSVAKNEVMLRSSWCYGNDSEFDSHWANLFSGEDVTSDIWHFGLSWPYILKASNYNGGNRSLGKVQKMTVDRQNEDVVFRELLRTTLKQLLKNNPNILVLQWYLGLVYEFVPPWIRWELHWLNIQR